MGRLGSNLVILAIWLAVLAVSAMSAAPWPENPIPTPVGVRTVLLVLPTLCFGFAGAVLPAHRLAPSRFETFVDSRWGTHAYESFLVRLRPILLLAGAGTAVLLTSALRAGSIARCMAAPPDVTFILGAVAGFVVLHHHRLPRALQFRERRVLGSDRQVRAGRVSEGERRPEEAVPAGRCL